VKLFKSAVSAKVSHRATVRGLGLKVTNHSVEVVDTPATRGMLDKVELHGQGRRLGRAGIRERKRCVSTRSSPPKGSNKAERRVGPGIGSGLGKTGGRGHKGQKSRSGGFTRSASKAARCRCSAGCRSAASFDNAQRHGRSAALGSRQAPVAEIDFLALQTAGVVPTLAKSAKVIKSGELTKAVKLSGIAVTKGAKAAIEAAGGSVA
jgi:large subunit ribosomal protein L15